MMSGFGSLCIDLLDKNNHLKVQSILFVVNRETIKTPALITKLHELNVRISIEDLRVRMSCGTFSAALIYCGQAAHNKSSLW